MTAWRNWIARQVPSLKVASSSLAVVATLLLSPAQGRDRAVVREFQKQFPCPVEGPGTCAAKGYQIDHVIALECGGADSVENLAYLNRESHKIKSKYDNLRCKNTWFGAIMRAIRFVRFWE